MKIQKVLKFIGDPRGLRICKKTVSGWSSILESGLEDVHTVVSTLTPGTKPAVALLKLAFPKATRQTATVVEELDNLHTKLYPIPSHMPCRLLLKAGCAPCLAGCRWYGICTKWVENLLFEVIL